MLKPGLRGRHKACHRMHLALCWKAYYYYYTEQWKAATQTTLLILQIGVELGPKGQIKVDGFNQTSVPSIYAVGDVTDRVNLTPVALMEGMAFAKNVFG